jgi:hypothetical protein
LEKGKSILEEEIDGALRSENVKYLEQNQILEGQVFLEGGSANLKK